MNEEIPIKTLIQNNRVEIPDKLNKVERQYTFEQIITKGEETTYIRYNFTVDFLRNKSDMSLFGRINRISPVFINDKEPDLVVDELAYETGKVFYPLSILLSEEGKFIRVSNYEEVVERWTKQRAKIADYFVGEIVDKYLLLADETIYSQDKLNRVFRRDIFMSVFFFPVYQYYNTLKSGKESECYFPLAGKSTPVKFRIEEILNEFLTDNHSIEISHSGYSIDKRSFHEIEWNYDEAGRNSRAADIKYFARYNLEMRTKLIQTIETRWDFLTDIPYTIEVKVVPLNGIPNKESLIVEIEEESHKETGFFQNLWDVIRGK